MRFSNSSKIQRISQNSLRQKSKQWTASNRILWSFPFTQCCYVSTCLILEVSTSVILFLPWISKTCLFDAAWLIRKHRHTKTNSVRFHPRKIIFSALQHVVKKRNLHVFEDLTPTLVSHAPNFVDSDRDKRPCFAKRVPIWRDGLSGDKRPCCFAKFWHNSTKSFVLIVYLSESAFKIQITASTLVSALVLSSFGSGAPTPSVLYVRLCWRMS